MKKKKAKTKIMQKGKGDNKKFEIRWDDKERVVRTKISGKQSAEDAQAFVKEVRDLIDKIGKKEKIEKVNSLNDASKAGLSIEPETRRIYTKWLKSGVFNKIAIFGLKTPQKMVVNFLAGFSKTNIKVFTKEKEALKWLKE